MIHVDIYHGNLNEKLIAQGTTLAKETVDPHMFARLKKAGLRFLNWHNSVIIPLERASAQFEVHHPA